MCKLAAGRRNVDVPGRGREISRYLSYDGTPGTGYDWATPADPTRYRQTIEGINALLGVD